MIFEFKNLGSIKEAQIEMGNLTVICGKNNTGKTYLTYAVYGFLKKLENYINAPNSILKRYAQNIVDELAEKDEITINIKEYYEVLQNELKSEKMDFCEQISNIFHTNSKEFENFSFDLILDEDYIFRGEKHYLFYGDLGLSLYQEKGSEIIVLRKRKNENLFGREYYTTQYIIGIIFKELFLHSFILSADRISLKLFQKELDFNRLKIVEELQLKKQLFLLNEKTSRYPMPLEHNIDFVRDIEQIQRNNSFLSQNNPEIIDYIENMLGIQYQKEQGYNFIVNTKTNVAFPHYLASTSVRSLADLHFWLKHQAHEGALLMIDEPELNLHPENQIKMARLFAKLVNVGIKVWITTHSDYIVKELNNLVMLGNVSDREEMLSRFKNEKGENEYSENDILKAEDLKAYIAYNLPDGSGATVRKIDVDRYGMVESTFDETINTMNKISRTFAQHIAD